MVQVSLLANMEIWRIKDEAKDIETIDVSAVIICYYYPQMRLSLCRETSSVLSLI